MNWGKGIVIGMVAFVSFIVSLSFCMFKQPADDYDKQYYEKGLAFDKDYLRERKVITDHAQPLIKQGKGFITIRFVKPATGTIRFISNLGRNKDRVFELITDADNVVTIRADRLITGQYNATLNWVSESNEYLYKQELYVNGK
ncbi:hypothetical protein D0C36_23925 [Mucilaginibacter conchicola]|uniref:Nitrogen fixation protein FixH n=1 Tax=Mucilaginibacter conchicola TaxID=2303333 RepID=A0A372NMX6_9SPHI|nr:FixH family protein [Mucilaginibacter conchicola]RFZ89947.1 hypothetical protein D0C36_23925 [Mucilaginibacter conchicola]